LVETAGISDFFEIVLSDDDCSEIDFFADFRADHCKSIKELNT
jgi:hypothetical protein